MEWINQRLRIVWPRFWPERDAEEMFCDAVSRLERALEDWELTPTERIDRGWVAIVLRCRGPEGEELILKVSPPHPEAENEALLAERFGGELFIPMMRARSGGATLLMEAADGRPLSALQPLAQAEICGRLSKRLASHPPPPGMRAYEELTAPPPALLGELIDGARRAMSFAEAAAAELASRPRLLAHGDLHAENVLSHRSEWLMIDGKGWEAPLAFESRVLIDSPGLADGDAEPLRVWAESIGVSEEDAWLGLAARCRNQIGSLPLDNPIDRAYGERVVKLILRCERAAG